MICTVIFCLVFTAPAKWRVELRAKIGQYRNRCLLFRGSGEGLGNCCQKPKAASNTAKFPRSPPLPRGIPQVALSVTLSTECRCSSLTSRHLTFRDVICDVTSQQCSIERSAAWRYVRHALYARRSRSGSHRLYWNVNSLFFSVARLPGSCKIIV